jgi:hypothetical protein
VTLDAARFADAWRAGWAADRVRSGELRGRSSTLHRMTLDKILVDFKFTTLNDEEKDALNRA